MTQLPLPFSHAPRYGREDFLVSPVNAAAFAAVEAWPAWPDRVLLLVGPEGTGKSHLARIWAERSGAAELAPSDLASDLTRIARTPALIEDLDRRPRPEAALFHLLNLVRDEGGALLVTARTPPGAWGLATADLVSRLRLAPTAMLAAPDEALLRAVIVKLFADRQLAVEPTVVDILAARLDRSLAAARAAVEALDGLALDHQRRISRALVFQHLAAGSDEG